MHTRCASCSISSVNEATVASAHGRGRMHLLEVVKPKNCKHPYPTTRKAMLELTSLQNEEFHTCSSSK